jgi:hypothetical protein
MDTPSWLVPREHLERVERDRDEQVRRATSMGDERNAAWVALRDIRDNFDCSCHGRGPKCQVCIATVALNGKVPAPSWALERLAAATEASEDASK